MTRMRWKASVPVRMRRCSARHGGQDWP